MEIAVRRRQPVAIIDHEAKLADGRAVGESANTELALMAWDHRVAPELLSAR